MENKIAANDSGNVYTFPRSEQIVIHKSDLQIQLENFKKAISATFSIFDLLTIASLWVPLLSGGFESNTLGLPPETVQGGYLVFAFMMTAGLLWHRFRYFKKRLEVSTDPKKMSEKILSQCSPDSDK